MNHGNNNNDDDDINTPEHRRRRLRAIAEDDNTYWTQLSTRQLYNLITQERTSAWTRSQRETEARQAALHRAEREWAARVAAARVRVERERIARIERAIERWRAFMRQRSLMVLLDPQPNLRIAEDVISERYRIDESPGGAFSRQFQLECFLYYVCGRGGRLPLYLAARITEGYELRFFWETYEDPDHYDDEFDQRRQIEDDTWFFIDFPLINDSARRLIEQIETIRQQQQANNHSTNIRLGPIDRQYTRLSGELAEPITRAELFFLFCLRGFVRSIDAPEDRSRYLFMSLLLVTEEIQEAINGALAPYWD